MSQHTPEPWQLGMAKTDIYDMYGCLAADTAVSLHDGATDEANARRIVACVNACAGIETEALEKEPKMYMHQIGRVLRPTEQQKINVLTAQRDELLAALKLYEQAFDEMFAQCCSNGMTDAWGRVVDVSHLNDAHRVAGPTIAKAEASL